MGCLNLSGNSIKFFEWQLAFSKDTGLFRLKAFGSEFIFIFLNLTECYIIMSSLQSFVRTLDDSYMLSSAVSRF
jgi:hypothetical protein